MSEFKVIESQEQLDAILKDRIERAKKTAEENAEKKFADYEALKQQNKELAEKLETAGASAKETEDRVKELVKANERYKLSNLKVKIAQEAGLPFELADRLSGEDEEAIKADAQNMAKYMSKPQVAPLGAAEPRTEKKDPFMAGLSELAKNINVDE
jgi:hypothetical protein